jgi:alginate O-acetyltransferase complex protein AlgI
LQRRVVFNSFHFAAFLLVVLPLYFSLRLRGQNWLLLAASLYFYATWDWRFLGLLLFTAGLDYWWAISIEQSPDRQHARKFLIFSVVGNLAVLGFFKYFNFFIASFTAMLARLGLEASAVHLEIILPLGISFYTFQEMSYVIDVYRREIRAERSLPRFLLFVCFFPHMIAGPIQRADTLLEQINHPRERSKARVIDGLGLAARGLFKKVFIADNLATHVVNPIFDTSLGFTGTYILLGVYGFAFQIYCDFSGYSDIARGIARLMGFELMENFKLPYFAKSPSDFWQRWHVSLSTWLRDYLYIPLGGNRSGHTERNLMLTMLLGGLWHGAAWNFVLWGLYHGVLLVVHRLVVRLRPPSVPERASVSFFKIVGMFHLTCLGWLIFRVESLDQLWTMLGRLFGEWYVVDLELSKTTQLLFYAAPIVILELIQRSSKTARPFGSWPWPARGLVYGVAAVLLLVFGDVEGREFIYFQF